jgi:CheY-like chemotaxis protein
MSSDRQRPKLLLVDDCIAQRDLYEMVLEPEFHVVTAARGRDALALVAAEHPDVVVLDVIMPGLDGWETCSRIKRHPRIGGTPVILLTGVDDRDLSQLAATVGAEAVLSKPCPAGRLLDQIHAALESRAAL